VERACAAGTQVSSISEGNLSEPNRTTGTNGVFVDECDATGMLTEYVCEAPFTCNGQCVYVQTGAVVPLKNNCALACKNGACTND